MFGRRRKTDGRRNVKEGYTMMKLIASIGLLVFIAGTPSNELQKYLAVETYLIRPGIIVTPFYTTTHVLCEMSIEKRHYAFNHVDIDAAMSEEEIVSLFDELVPQAERGGPGRLPAGMEISESDLGVIATSIPYKNVTLEMHGLKDRPDRQKYVAAIISWNNVPCYEK